MPDHNFINMCNLFDNLNQYCSYKIYQDEQHYELVVFSYKREDEDTQIAAHVHYNLDDS